MKARWFFFFSLTLAVVYFGAVVPAWAAFPDRPVRFIVGFPPSGTADTLARFVAQRLTEKWGQPVVVENRPGADGTIAGALVARSAPNGYTIMMATTNHTTTPSQIKLDYDPVNDFTPITNIAFSPNVLLVNAALPVSSFQDFLVLARSKPGSLNFSSPGQGAAPFLLMELLKKRAGIDLLHIPYKGTAPSMMALLQNDVQAMFGSVSTSFTLVKEGKLKALAVSARQRIDLMPQVPTVAEAGNLPGFEGGTWFGVMAPAKLPKDIQDRLHDDIVDAVRAPPIQKFFAEQGIVTIADTPAQFGKFVVQDIKTWAELINSLKLK